MSRSAVQLSARVPAGAALVRATVHRLGQPERVSIAGGFRGDHTDLHDRRSQGRSDSSRGIGAGRSGEGKASGSRKAAAGRVRRGLDADQGERGLLRADSSAGAAVFRVACVRRHRGRVRRDGARRGGVARYVRTGRARLAARRPGHPCRRAAVDLARDVLVHTERGLESGSPGGGLEPWRDRRTNPRDRRRLGGRCARHGGSRRDARSPAVRPRGVGEEARPDFCRGRPAAAMVADYRRLYERLLESSSASPAVTESSSVRP